jgi:hypothetical protein
MEDFLDEQRNLLDTDFPPEGYTKLRAQPGESVKAAVLAWKAGIGLKIVEEEVDPLDKERPYDYKFSDPVWSWDRTFQQEYYERRL